MIRFCSPEPDSSDKSTLCSLAVFLARGDDLILKSVEAEALDGGGFAAVISISLIGSGVLLGIALLTGFVATL